MSDALRPWPLALPLVLLAGCGAQGNVTPPSPAPMSTVTTAAPAPPTAGAGSTTEPTAESVHRDGGAPAPPTCPEGMALVDTSYCPKPERTCLEEEYNAPNHLTICHRYSETQKCAVAEEHRRFCIDEYEYPNRRGGHPPWMVSWYDGQATCASLGKRLCYATEWEAACEGPEKTPFPNGFSRDNAKCNIDNQWIDPRLSSLFSKDPAARDRELARLDQSVASGDMSGCASGFGVHDMTGNFDEWVTSDYPVARKSEWAGLKGGAWGHVRNACRPMTTSHPPDFKYYFVSFRCCADAPGGEPYTPRRAAKPPQIAPENRAPEPRPEGAPGPSKRKVGRENHGRKRAK